VIIALIYFQCSLHLFLLFLFIYLSVVIYLFLRTFSFFSQAREAQKRANFLSQETDRWTKDKSNLQRTLSDCKIEMKGNNDFISKVFLSDAREWMDGLKKRIAMGGEVFRGTHSTVHYITLHSSKIQFSVMYFFGFNLFPHSILFIYFCFHFR
jgi:hypothetical protein